MSKQKVKKPYSIKDFAKVFIGGSIVILYIVLYAGNGLIGVFGDIFVRYIPVAVAGFLVTMSYVKSGAKKLKISEKDAFKKMSIVIPIVVAVIMIAYGCYSTSRNISSLRNQYEVMANIYSLYDESGDSFNDSLKEAFDEAQSKAYTHWFITSISYLVFAEMGVFLATKNLDKLMKKDEEVSQEDKGEEQVTVADDEKLDLTTNNNIVSEPTGNNSIKWDL